jgi:uncharacterized protein YegL
MPTGEDKLACLRQRAQVLVALDGSGSISDQDWERFMAFTDTLIEHMPIAPGEMKMGLIEFASTAALVQPLSDSKEAVLEGRRENVLRNHGVRTYMGKATQIARNVLTDASVPRVMLMITDGLPSSRANAATQFLAAKAEGIKVVMVTVGFLANMIPPSNSWLSIPPVKIRAGFRVLDQFFDSIVESVTSSVCHRA